VIVPKLDSDGQVTVDMGPPEFEPAKIPFLADQQALTYRIEVGGQNLEISALSMGNPHAVQVVESVDRAPVVSQGPLIETHARFPQRTNAGYLEVVDRSRIKLRVYERGAGETFACGTGACAAVVVGVTRGYLDSPVSVQTRGGRLVVAWAGGRRPVMLTGGAETVFEGAIEI
jgi:diaminopimelate epimerase